VVPVEPPEDPIVAAVHNEVPVDQLRLGGWDDIEAFLKKVPDIDPGYAILEAGKKAAADVPKDDLEATWFEARQTLIRERFDCAGLPFRAKDVAQSNWDRVVQMSNHGLALHRAGVGDFSNDRYLCAPDLIANKQFHQPEAIPALEQLLGAEDDVGRIALVRILARIRGSAASEALARRVLFEFAPKIRQEAIRVLRARPPEEYRPVLLEGLRYPWPVVARHATDALIELNDRKAIPALIAELQREDPASPTRDAEGGWSCPQLVRVNHLRNCLLCHAPSLNSSGALRGVVPSPSQFLRRRREGYYEPRQSPTGVFVRGDIVYLRQDFSLMQYAPTSKSSFWPGLQRYDYLIRRVPIDEEDACKWHANHAAEESPHRQAILAALRELTCIDAGSRAEDWQMVLAKMRTND
jgi:hypothetical protein